MPSVRMEELILHGRPEPWVHSYSEKQTKPREPDKGYSDMDRLLHVCPNITVPKDTGRWGILVKVTLMALHTTLLVLSLFKQFLIETLPTLFPLPFQQSYVPSLCLVRCCTVPLDALSLGAASHQKLTLLSNSCDPGCLYQNCSGWWHGLI